MQPSIPVCQARPPTWAESDSATRVSRAKCRSREPHTTNSVTAAHQHRRHGDHERETESQHQRVGHTSEASGRIQEPQGKQKVNNKESSTPGRRIQSRGKRKVHNKESVTSASRPEDQETHGKTESQQQIAPQEIPKHLKKPQTKTK